MKTVSKQMETISDQIILDFLRHVLAMRQAQQDYEKRPLRKLRMKARYQAFFIDVALKRFFPVAAQHLTVTTPDQLEAEEERFLLELKTLIS